MTRALTADDLIQLPRLSANEAAVLATELLGVATTTPAAPPSPAAASGSTPSAPSA